MKNQGGRISLIFLWATLIVLFPMMGRAQHSHDHSGHVAPSGKSAKPKESTSAKLPWQSVTVEGLKVSFEVMTMEEHMKHTQTSKGHREAHPAQSHSFMVVLQDTFSKEIISDAKVMFTVQGPAGEKETGKLAWSGDHYGEDIDLKGKGTYQVQLMIESGGMEREAKFTHETK